MTVSANRFLLEIDGIAGQIEVTEVNAGGITHTPHTYQPGNRPNPARGLGNFEVEEVSFVQARGLGTTATQLVQWLMDCLQGREIRKRNLRVITLDEAGRVPVETVEYLSCLPTGYKPDNFSGSSSDVATFTFTVIPEDMRVIFGRNRVTGVNDFFNRF